MKIATVGIDIGKTCFHLVGFTETGAIVVQVDGPDGSRCQPPRRSGETSDVWFDDRKIMEAGRLIVVELEQLVAVDLIDAYR